MIPPDSAVMARGFLDDKRWQNEMTVGMVEVAPSFLNKNNLIVDRAVVHGKSPSVMLLNTTSSPKIVEEGSVLGLMQPISNISPVVQDTSAVDPVPVESLPTL